MFLSSGFAPPRGMARPGAMKQPSEERSQRLGGQGASSEDLQYTMGVQQVHECLKQKAKSSQLTGIDCKREVLRLLSETLIDVQSDQVDFLFAVNFLLTFEYTSTGVQAVQCSCFFC